VSLKPGTIRVGIGSWYCTRQQFAAFESMTAYAKLNKELRINSS